MGKTFGELASGQKAKLYTISNGTIKANITDYGATLVSLFVDGLDVVLGYDNVKDYEVQGGYLGAVVGRNANRIAGAEFEIPEMDKFKMSKMNIKLVPNEGKNSLHSGKYGWSHRIWREEEHTENSLKLSLFSPDGDQGFPGTATVFVTYTIENDGLSIVYEATTDQDTVFNLTNHAYFNLYGHQNTDKAMDQLLQIPGEEFCLDNKENIPTGVLRSVVGTPFDFRRFKAIGRDIDVEDKDRQLEYQGGYDHNYVNKFSEGENMTTCAVLKNPDSGLTMTVITDCPGVQVYSGNFLDNTGKGGTVYGKRTGVALETQFFPNAVNLPGSTDEERKKWRQPFFTPKDKYRSETKYQFKVEK